MHKKALLLLNAIAAGKNHPDAFAKGRTSIADIFGPKELFREHDRIAGWFARLAELRLIEPKRNIVKRGGSLQEVQEFLGVHDKVYTITDLGMKALELFAKTHKGFNYFKIFSVPKEFEITEVPIVLIPYCFDHGALLNINDHLYKPIKIIHLEEMRKGNIIFTPEYMSFGKIFGKVYETYLGKVGRCSYIMLDENLLPGDDRTEQGHPFIFAHMCEHSWLSYTNYLMKEVTYEKQKRKNSRYT